jgi:hypothetical protein
MQPRNLLVVAGALEVLPPEVEPELGDGEDEPHAARRRAATAEAAPTLNDILNAYLLKRGSGKLPHGRRLYPQPQPAGAV